MDTENLKQSLSQLRADLANTSTSDPELQRMLLQLEQEIQHKLALAERGQEQPAWPAGEAETDISAAPLASTNASGLPDEQPGLAQRTQEISARFAVDHPRLEPVLRELGAILERIGI
ncbi:MAG: DUF4404 family protein [Janthinobacterium lividum]